MDLEEIHQALDTCALDLAYEKCLRQYDLVQEKENIRNLRVQVLLLENENDNLLMQINEDDEYIQNIEHGQSALKTEIEKLQASLESANGEARVKGREIETLKAELQSLHSVTMNSTKLLTEKLALARELSTLRPEIDHFRSQVASHQSLLAEKLSLEHQLSTVRLELESEKKSMQRILTKDGKARAEDAKVDTQLQTVKADLLRERRERQKLERENQEASHTWDAQKMALESRLETFRSKLRTTKNSLKDAQQELQDARSTARVNGNDRADAQRGRSTAENARKRNATQMLSDSMIGTPGDMVDDRRTKRPSTLPGDKSTFSITPYLNRTASVAPESPQEDGIQVHDAVKVDKATVSAQDTIKKTMTVSPAVNAEKTQSNQPNKAGPRKNLTVKAKVVQGRKTGTVLEQVAEVEDNEDDMIEANLRREIEHTAGDDTALGDNEVGRKKKRRLFGGGPSKTLFDEDEPETIVPGVKARAFGSLSKGLTGGPKNRSLLTASLASGNKFGAFSPLKRDRQPNAARA
ncbi:MAG: hypothetical protein Q9218_001040 [Villophora microphyllina]